MEDKTAAIPSLKDFKDKQKGKDTSQRRQKKTASEKKRVSQDTMRIDELRRSAGTRGQKTTDKSKKKPASAPSTYARDRLEHKTSAQSRTAQSNKRKPTDYDSSRRVDRSAQTDRRTNVQNKPAPKQRASSSYYDDIVPARPASQQSRKPVSQRPAQRTASPAKKTVSRKPAPKKTAARKPKQPLTPAKRKARNIVICVSMLLVVLIVFGVLSLTVFFKAKKFEINGIDRYTNKEIILASGISTGDNIFTADKSGAEERIEQMCPYVESANVYSVFPDAIGIDLTMAKPACKIEAIGGVYLLSDKGKVLERVSSEYEVDVPFIKGVQIRGKDPGEFVDFGSDVLKSALTEMFTAFEQMDSTRITEIDIVTKGDIFELRYAYDDRIVVYLGIPEEITYKLKAADVIIKEHLDAAKDATITGELDVSDCHETGNSYFNEYSILAPDIAAEEEPTVPPTTAYSY